jgi:hypothetical protein
VQLVRPGQLRHADTTKEDDHDNDNDNDRHERHAEDR